MQGVFYMSKVKDGTSFSSSIGFILSSAGSAVGLGNLWRFPYLASEYGGGVFLLVYLILTVTFGFTLIITEVAIGRKTGLGVIGAYKSMHNKFGFLSTIASLVPIVILPYYSLIGGWVTKYMISYITGQGSIMSNSEYFHNFTSNTLEPIVYLLIFLTITTLIVLFGVQKGIENVSKFMMPILFLLTVGITIYALTIDGVSSCVKYYLIPNFSHFSIKTLLSALGQLFYSMSIATGVMITFGSYTPKDINIVKSVNQIELWDTIMAFLSGLMIIPAVIFFEGLENMGQGAGLMFITLPKIFNEMPNGHIVGGLFFILVFFAGITSAISMMEAIVRILMDRFSLKRTSACILILISNFILGVPSSLGYGVWEHIKILGMDILSFFDFLGNSVIMPIIALTTCLLVSWFCNVQSIIDEIKFGGVTFKKEALYKAMIKYVCPAFILAILIFSLLEGLGIVVV